MSTTNNKNLGHATAYGYAKSKGYTGTEEEFAELMASYADVGQTAVDAALAAQTAKGKAEEAQGKAEEAQGKAEEAQGKAENAQAAAEQAAREALAGAGTPLVAASAAAMTDQTKIYVYLGSETGYTNGDWYYWDGASWTSGGVYNAQALETDTTLTLPGRAADAKAAGDAIASADKRINYEHSLVNYGYDTAYHKEADPSGSTTEKIGMDRVGTTITLNKAEALASNVRIRISGSIQFAVNTSTVDGWTNGLALQTGHQYRARAYLMSGTSDVGTTDKLVPVLHVYKTGTHSSVGTGGRSEDGLTYTVIFTAEEDATYILALYVTTTYGAMTNACIVITLEDQTESEMCKANNEIGEANDTLVGLIGREKYSPTWESGRYDPSTGKKVNSSSHIRTSEKFAYTDTLAIIVRNYKTYNARYRLTFFDANDVHIYTTGFLRRACMIKDVAPVGTSTFAVSVNATSIDTSYGDTIRITENYNTLLPPDSDLQTIMYGNKQESPIWESGLIDKDSGEDAISNTFIRTADYIAYSSSLVIVLTNALGKLRFRVFYYSDDDAEHYLGYSGDQSNSFHKRGIRLSDFAPEGTEYFRIAVTTFGSDSVTPEMGGTVVISDGRYMLLPLDEQITEIIEELKEQGIDQLPDYYDGYIRGKAKDIVTIQNDLSTNSVQFFLISDYHTRTNEGHSKAMIRQLSAQTGITMLCYTGDGGGSLGSTDDQRLEAIIRTSEVWDGLENSVREFYGTLGNHEWITASYFHRSAVTNIFLGRYKNTAFDMEPYYGAYSVDNKYNKVRYYFLQCTSAAVANGYTWMAEDLQTIPDGYNVAVFMHHGAIPGAASAAEYDGVVLPDDGNSNDTARRIADILHQFETHGSISFTISGVTYSYDYSARTGDDAVIGIFCGHYHHGTLFEKDDELNAYDVMVFRASTDSLQAASIAVDRTPWYWEDGIIGGTKVIRESHTVDEQCFYAVQIDLDSKDVYITAIGGDHDWQTSY